MLFITLSLVLLMTVVADTFRPNMFVVLCLIASVIPWTIVEGKGCWADKTSPGKECISKAVLPGGPELGIRYYFTAPFSYICCDVLTCNYRDCKFVYVGCGQSVKMNPIQTNPYSWVFRFVEPMMRCHDRRGIGAYYSFTADVVPIET